MELTTIVGNLLASIDADAIAVRALELANQPTGTDPGDACRNRAQEQLVGEAAEVFTGDLVSLLESIRRDREQTIDHDNLDNLQRSEWDKDAANNAQALADEFAGYLREHKVQRRADGMAAHDPRPCHRFVSYRTRRSGDGTF
ncbi:MAG: hypothetical protein PHF56_13355 [Desulfuromonadaceae bacterium]|nr:hypothetical protein [Desulfuromonadaceae bacterium]